MMGDGYTESFKRRILGKELVFVWLPKRCHLSNKWLWLTTAYKETAVWTSISVFFEYRYYDKKEYLFAKIKGTV